MPFRLGPTELIIILVIVLLIFGAGKMPQIGGAMGKAIRNFKSGISGKDDISDDATEDLKIEEQSERSNSKK
ncbi:MAG: twin-arginine translocase TatA/TatE family subunit [Dehalococcoidia bacterium]|nr:twin-arginine translocase TatA/TatE family subunit [Dehalococcoidia bacterium]MQG15272.1 twin-arginine translocase TatA/TatE family subunit [SAR202 cluster bacterium]|tara:strand:+ start:5704 stop:5919 length:216 start_codon:yes stop_codon:yes gene_type:complete